MRQSINAQTGGKPVSGVRRLFCGHSDRLANHAQISDGGSWRTRMKWSGSLLGLVLLAMQLLPSPIPSLIISKTFEPAHLRLSGKPEVGAILERSCMDCHSNDTRLPWYGSWAPASWMIAQHVAHGRAKLNFSTWNSRRHTANELEELCDAVFHGSMPLRSYTVSHRDATLSKSDIDRICAWADAQAGLQTQTAAVQTP
jgi:hypothetical protein